MLLPFETEAPQMQLGRKMRSYFEPFKRNV